MTLHRNLVLALVSLCGLLLVACKRGDGPLLINLSGQTVHVHIVSEHGEPIEGECEDQAAVWTGEGGNEPRRIEVVLGPTTHVLEGDELLVPFGKDPMTAFVIEAQGLRKLTVEEAQMLMRTRRPDVIWRSAL